MNFNYAPLSIRTFIGAKNYETSKSFYRDLGYEEVYISPKMNLYKVNDKLSFYLQEYYEKKWINNSMVFLEVDDLVVCHDDIKSRNLIDKYKYVRLSNIVDEDWGREFFLHDPSGVLWHFGTFNDSINKTI